MLNMSGVKAALRKGTVSFLFMIVGGLAVSAETVVPRGYEDAQGAVVDMLKEYVYVWTGTVPGKLMKVELSTLHTVNTLNLGDTDGPISFCVIDGNVNTPQRTFAYCGTGTSPAKILKIDLSDLSVKGSLTLNSGENNVVSGVIDSLRGIAYFGTNTSPGRIVKVRLSDVSRVGAITLGDGENDARPAAIEMRTGNAYFGAFGNGQSKVIRLNVLGGNFSRAGALVLGSDPTSTDCVKGSSVKKNDCPQPPPIGVALMVRWGALA